MQGKWEEDYDNFIKKNYLVADGWVKANDEAIAAAYKHDSLQLFEDTSAAFHIFRMTSFSLAKPTRKSVTNWLNTLREKLNKNNQFVLNAFDKARKLYDLENETREEYLAINFDKFKRLYAWLLNICLPQIECLIVDEAHNFKHGVDKNVSTRNKLTARFFGAISVENDKDLLKDLPDLKTKVSSKVKKLIFLSATPIDRNLVEIPKQLDCFLPLPMFQNAENRAITFIKNNINAFMIRGLMELTLTQKTDNQITEKTYSRNQYRHEHRNGNVSKTTTEPLTLDDDLHGLVMGLVQYKVIKEIGENSGNVKAKKGVKNNKSFEIGMLASYESFNQSKVKKEYEDKTEKDSSIDKNVLNKLVKSYNKAFKKPLPHPKQDKLVDILFEYTKNQEKALVFVRRIGSVIELEQRLLHRYEDYLNSKIETLRKEKRTFDTDDVNSLLKAFSEKHLEKDKLEIFKNIWEYLTSKGIRVRQEVKLMEKKPLINLLSIHL